MVMSIMVSPQPIASLPSRLRESACIVADTFWVVCYFPFTTWDQLIQRGHICITRWLHGLEHMSQNSQFCATTRHANAVVSYGSGAWLPREISSRESIDSCTGREPNQVYSSGKTKEMGAHGRYDLSTACRLLPPTARSLGLLSVESSSRSHTNQKRLKRW